MKHEDVIAYIDGELPPEETKKVEAALDRDPALRKLASEYCRQKLMLAETLRDEARARRSARGSARSSRRLRAASSRVYRTRRRRSSVKSWAVPIAVAACLVLAFHLVNVLSTPKPRDAFAALLKASESISTVREIRKLKPMVERAIADEITKPALDARRVMDLEFLFSITENPKKKEQADDILFILDRLKKEKERVSSIALFEKAYAASNLSAAKEHIKKLEYRKAVSELSGTSGADAVLLRGWCLRQLGKNTKAHEEFSKADSNLGAFMIARTFERENKFEKAAKGYDSLGEKVNRAYFYAGYAWKYYAENHEKAEASFAKLTDSRVKQYAMAGILLRGGSAAAVPATGIQYDIPYSLSQSGLFKPTSINNLGYVTLYSISKNKSKKTYCNNPLLSKNIIITELGGTETVAQAINDKMQIVGWSANKNGIFNAFLQQNNEMTLLHILKDRMSQAYDINNKGHIVGVANEKSNLTRAFLWKDGRFEYISNGGMWPYTINDHGRIAGKISSKSLKQGFGFKAFLLKDGKVTYLADYGGKTSEARDINNSDQVVGWSKTKDGNNHAILWENNKMTDLGTLGGKESYAYGINDNGLIVGKAQLPDESFHAVIWKDGKIKDLNNLLLLRTHQTLENAAAVNNKGHIAVAGYIRGGEKYFYYLKPAASPR